MGLISWYKECKRAKLIGRTFTKHWYDPVTEKTWMCEHRYGIRTGGKDSPENIASMCYHIGRHSESVGSLTSFGKECLPEKYKS